MSSDPKREPRDARDAGSIRRATAADLEAVRALDPIAASGDENRGRLLHAAIATGDCAVHERAGEVTGFVILRRHHFFDRDFVELLKVSPAIRRQGIGGALLRHAVDAATTAAVFTSTNESNSPMRALLDTEGWILSGKLVGLDEDDPELVFFRPNQT